MENQIQVVLIDHYQIFREGVKKVLEKDSSINVIASSDDYSILDYVLKANQIDVVLLDAKIFIHNQEHVKNVILYSDVKIIVLGTDAEKGHVKEAIKAGVHGYLFKEMDMFAFVDAIKLIITGESYYHPNITSDLVNEYRKSLQAAHRKSEKTPVHRPLHLYTRRECEVLQLLTDGQSNRDIAKSLNISEKTVKNHVSSLFKKMQVHDRTQAVVKAIKNKWVEL